MPLNKEELHQLMLLLRKIWKYKPDTPIGRIAKNLFQQLIEEEYNIT